MPRAPLSRPARVLLITTHYYPILGGVETHARDLAEGLRRRGRRVTVLTARVDRADHRRVARVGRVPVLRRGPVGRRRWTKWWFIPTAFVAAIRLRRRVDVVFCPDLRGVGVATLAAAWWLGVPGVIQGATPGAYSADHWLDSASRLALPVPRPLIRAAQRLLQALHRRASAAVCITREHEREALASGIAADRIHYLPHGIDTTRFAPAIDEARRQARSRLGCDDSRLVVLFLGRLSAEKGVMDLLEAWSRRPHPEARLLLVGPDMPGHAFDRGNEVRSFIATHQLEGSVIVAGPTDVPAEVLQAADVLVQPSHYEAFPLTVLEAMACGVPVVASEVGGLRDYLVDGENALLHPPHRPDLLAARLDACLSDASLRARLGREGREVVTARFDRERNLDGYERVFDDAVARGDGPAGSV